MKKTKALVFCFLTLVLIWAMGKSWGPIPPLGPFLHPSLGFWAQAVPVKSDLSFQSRFPGLKKPIRIPFDQRRIPHIQAESLEDAFFSQGYIHACFRLWQMDMQTRAAGGRLSEVLGLRTLEFDRKQRRKGMIYGAENSLKAMMADSLTRTIITAYTRGVNAFVHSLEYRQYPLEYKLMDFAPEPWTPLKTALLLLYMADELSGGSDDLLYTHLYSQYPDSLIDLIYPIRRESSIPFIPASTSFPEGELMNRIEPTPAFLPSPLPASLSFGTEGKGSNAWVVHGSRTEKGKSLLANDPHLRLGLPSLWFEMQIQGPGLNCYGVSLPGAPGIIIGFNDSLAWGMTNNYQDVKDYYLLDLDAEKRRYAYGDQWVELIPRLEPIAVKGKDTVQDTVYYSVHGPVEYPLTETWTTDSPRAIAMSWTAHDSTNELKAIILMNKAQNREAFEEALKYFQVPAQNLVFADVEGNIAGYAQGKWVMKQQGQGRRLLSGKDPRNTWTKYVPQEMAPKAINPEQGFLQAANQITTGPDYPYWYQGSFSEFRSWRLQELLDTASSATLAYMKSMQADNYSKLAEKALPIMLSCLNTSELSGQQREALDLLRRWNYTMDAEANAPSLFQLWWTLWKMEIWTEYLEGLSSEYWPDNVSTLEWTERILVQDTAAKRGLWARNVLSSSFQRALDSFKAMGPRIPNWRDWDPISLNHLSGIPALGIHGLGPGGSAETVNAQKRDYGPGWRMVVELDRPIKARGVYAGGQSGNPGSVDYGKYVEAWAEGEYFELLLIPMDGSLPSSELHHQWTFIPL